MRFSIFDQKSDSQKTLNVIARASENLGTSLDYSETIAQVCKVGVPLLADWTVLFVLDEKTSSFSFSYCCHHNQKLNKKFNEFFRNSAESYIKRPVVMDTLRKGKAVTEIIEVPSLLSGFTLNLPLIQNSAVIGILTLGSKNNFSAEDVLLAEKVAQRAACALYNSICYQRINLAKSVLTDEKKINQSALLAKNEFFANISHEIRTPVSAILGFTDLLMMPDNSEEDRILFGQRIKHNSKHLLRLIEDVLSFAKIESGHLSLENNSVFFNEFYKDLEHLFLPQAQSKKLKLNFLLESSVPVEFCTDVTRLHQILTNIIGNAIKFTDSGGIKVSAGFKKEAGILFFDVEDTGPGLTEKQSLQLFQPFIQSDSKHAKNQGGTGLGLALSLKMARLLGGDIEIVYTAEGCGSMFRVCIKPEVSANVAFIDRPQ